MSDPQSHWDKKYTESPEVSTYSQFLTNIENYLPNSGTCVDLAGGNGRNALWFAEKGYETSLIDISSVALNQAKEAAADRGVELECLQRDLEKTPLPEGRKWDIALVTLFLDRGLLMRIPNSLAKSGILLFAHPTKTNLERHEHPSEKFLLEPGEIFNLGERLIDMEILHMDELWRESGRHEAWIVCRKRRKC